MWTMYFIVYSSMICFYITYAEGNIQACGSELTDLLSLLCGNQFHGPGKRSIGEEKSSINTIIKRTGVVDECCHSQCDLETLQLYCRFSPGDIEEFNNGKENDKEKNDENGAVIPSLAPTTPRPSEGGQLSMRDINRIRYRFVQRLGRIRRMKKHVL